MTDLKVLGPYEIELKIHCVHEDGAGAVASYMAPLGVELTKEKLDECAEKTVAQLNDQMDGGWRLATRPEFLNSLIQERTGSSETFAVTGGDEWDEPDE